MHREPPASYSREMFYGKFEYKIVFSRKIDPKIIDLWFEEHMAPETYMLIQGRPRRAYVKGDPEYTLVKMALGEHFRDIQS